MSGTPSNTALDKDLRGYLERNADILTRITKPVRLDDVGALSAQSEMPIIFEDIVERSGFRVCDILVKNRLSQARALGVAPEDYLKTLAYRLRQPPRGFKKVDGGPVKEVIRIGDAVDLTVLPLPPHTEGGRGIITAMNIMQDPETGYYNSSHAGTQVIGPREALSVFATPHSVAIMKKYKARGESRMPIAFVLGVHPAYEIMANFSGLHMDSWGEMEMVGTIMDQDIEMVPCETVNLMVPAHAEIVVEGWVDLTELHEVGPATAPSMYAVPRRDFLPKVTATAITMRKDRPIYRNHQTVPETDHQPLPRLCHEAVLYNRLSEMGLDVKDVRFPTWGGALSCIVQFTYPRPGCVNDALLQTMGSPWLNTKMVVAVSPDTDLDNPGDVYHAIASRCDPARDIVIVPATRASPYDPSGSLIADQYFWRTGGKMGIDATIKPHFGMADEPRAWPKNWGKVKLQDFL